MGYIPCTLLAVVVFVSFFVGCYPEPEVEPVRPTAEHIEQMRKATLPDGTPLSPRWSKGTAKKLKASRTSIGKQRHQSLSLLVKPKSETLVCINYL